jgi:penicillin-binding protein 1A
MCFRQKKKSWQIRALNVFLISVLGSLLALALIGTVLVASAAREVDAEADLALISSFSGSRTTRLYCHKGRFDPSLPLNSETYIPTEYDSVFGNEDMIWCTSEEIPDRLREAFIAIEDRKFYRHDGVDWLRTGKAAASYLLRLDSHFGGSTITQQLIKNVSGENEITVGRKVREIIRATLLERRLGKEEILNCYLNIIPLANRCYGVGAAARYYFGKRPLDLTVAECATIAAITNSPVRYDPVRHPEANRKRRDLILRKMEEYGYLTSEEKEAALAEEPSFVLRETGRGQRVHSWYTETVISDVVRDLAKKYRISEDAARRMVYGGGLRIHTYCVREFQDAADRYFQNLANFGGERESLPAYAFLLMDPRNGAILAIEGAAGVKSGNRLLNYATDALRPPGSALKPPALYAPALKARLIHYASVFEDIPEENGTRLWPQNSPASYMGRIGIHEALARSKNTVAVRLYRMLGAEAIAKGLREDFGITTLVRSMRGKSGEMLTDYAAAPLALGQLTRGVTLRDITAAYTVFAAGGTYRAPKTYLAVYDRDGTVLLEERKAENAPALTPEDAYIMTRMMQETVKYGTASALTLSAAIETAGKTGTSGGNMDRWFIGYTPYLLGGILKTGNGSSLDGRGSSHLRIWDELMKRFHAAYLSGEWGSGGFAVPDGIVECRFCQDSGQLPGRFCGIDLRGDRCLTGPFTWDNLPEAECKTHIPVKLYGEDDPFGRLCAALDDTGRKLPEGIEVADHAYDAEALFAKGAEPLAPPEEIVPKRKRFFEALIPFWR